MQKFPRNDYIIEREDYLMFIQHIYKLHNH